MRSLHFCLAACVMLLSACEKQSVPAAESVDQTEISYESVLAAAEQALAEAASRRNVWLQTENLLQASKVANEEGRTAEAIELATEARLQAELAVQQAESEKEAWRTRVLPDH